ncbi:MAG: oleate hydratase [Burkholderiales bacterium]|nr:MAG: oleate hydratase [Burkholderiales bacterium]
MDTSETRTKTAAPFASRPRAGIRAYLVGGGIASLAAAVYLIRDAGVPGAQIQILEQAHEFGGSLDAGGSAEQGYTMRGSRMFGAAYGLTYDLLDGIPSLDDPSRSVTQDTLEFSQAAEWHAGARLIERGQVRDTSSLGFDNRDRVALIQLMLNPEASLGAATIEQCFGPHFFGTNFWFMWCSMFGFEPWHSAAEFRRYVLRFLLLLPELASMRLIQTTRYNGRDSIVTPLVRWLKSQGVRLRTGVEATDLEFAEADGARSVTAIHWVERGRPGATALGADDLAIVTLGSMTAGASLGTMDAPPRPAPQRDAGSWNLWRRVAARGSGFGRPQAFCEHVERTRWITFTVTPRDGRFFERMQALCGRPAGRGGLVTVKDSPWLLTFHLYHPPAYAGQPESQFVSWGYGLFADRPGRFVPKPMLDCSGREILVELFSMLGWQDDLDQLLAGATCRPCLLPYTTSQFMPRAPDDRPQVVPEGARNFAFVGQYCEIPDDVVYTVEYSVHSALRAVATLFGFTERIPPTYQGLRHASALTDAMRIILA